MVPADVQLNVKNSSGDLYCEGIRSKYNRLRASSGDISVRSMKGELNVMTTSGELSINNLIGSLETESSSGDQELMNIVGNVTCRATSGGLKLKDIEGDVVSRTSSGDVEIDQLVGRLKNVSTSGNLEIDNSKVRLNLTATSGDIEGNGVILTGESYFNTSSGNVHMELKNDPDLLSFDLTASSGNLKAGSKRAERKLFFRNGEIWIHGKSSSGDQTYN